jgi:hypothetical protein
MFEIVNLRRLSKISGIPYQRLYENIVGKYDSLSLNEKTHLYNCLIGDLEGSFEWLGFKNGKRAR